MQIESASPPMITLRKISGPVVHAYSTFLEVLIEMPSGSSFACLTLRMQGKLHTVTRSPCGHWIR